MTALGIAVMAAGTATILVGIVALFRSARFITGVQRSRAVFLAMCVLAAGFVVGYIGVSINTGASPIAAVISAVAVVAIAGSVWRVNVMHAQRAETRRRDKGPQR